MNYNFNELIKIKNIYYLEFKIAYKSFLNQKL